MPQLLFSTPSSGLKKQSFDKMKPVCAQSYFLLKQIQHGRPASTSGVWEVAMILTNEVVFPNTFCCACRHRVVLLRDSSQYNSD